MEFKVGDRVRVINKYGGKETLTNKCGKVIFIENNSLISVEFDEYIYGHSSDGKGKVGFCWNTNNETELELISNEKLEKKKPTYIVIWDEKSKDPHKFFTDEKSARDFMKELIEKQEVIKESIILVKIASAEQVTISKLVRYKHYLI